MLEINNTTKYQINKPKLQAIYGAFLKEFKRPKAEVSLAVVGPSRMRAINNIYRGQDKTTDVLSFPASDLEDKNYLGEIIIDKDEAAKVTKYQKMLGELDMSFKKTDDRKKYLFYFLFVHGLLHLVGYTDETEKDRLRMLIIGRDFLERVL